MLSGLRLQAADGFVGCKKLAELFLMQVAPLFRIRCSQRSRLVGDPMLTRPSSPLAWIRLRPSLGPPL